VACDEVAVSACVLESESSDFFFFTFQRLKVEKHVRCRAVYTPRAERDRPVTSKLNCRRGVMRGVNKKDDTTHGLVCAVFVTFEPVLSND
jgi:hypothetical protein